MFVSLCSHGGVAPKEILSHSLLQTCLVGKPVASTLNGDLCHVLANKSPLLILPVIAAFAMAKGGRVRRAELAAATLHL